MEVFVSLARIKRLSKAKMLEDESEILCFVLSSCGAPFLLLRLTHAQQHVSERRRRCMHYCFGIGRRESWFDPDFLQFVTNSHIPGIDSLLFDSLVVCDRLIHCYRGIHRYSHPDLFIDKALKIRGLLQKI